MVPNETRACVLCHEARPAKDLRRSRCEVTGEDVWTCFDAEACLERFRERGPAIKVAQLLAAVRARRRRPGGD